MSTGKNKPFADIYTLANEFKDGFTMNTENLCKIAALVGKYEYVDLPDAVSKEYSAVTLGRFPIRSMFVPYMKPGLSFLCGDLYVTKYISEFARNIEYQGTAINSRLASLVYALAILTHKFDAVMEHIGLKNHPEGLMFDLSVYHYTDCDDVQEMQRVVDDVRRIEENINQAYTTYCNWAKPMVKNKDNKKENISLRRELTKKFPDMIFGLCSNQHVDYAYKMLQRKYEYYFRTPLVQKMPDGKSTVEKMGWILKMDKSFDKMYFTAKPPKSNSTIFVDMPETWKGASHTPQPKITLPDIIGTTMSRECKNTLWHMLLSWQNLLNVSIKPRKFDLKLPPLHLMARYQLPIFTVGELSANKLFNLEKDMNKQNESTTVGEYFASPNAIKLGLTQEAVLGGFDILEQRLCNNVGKYDFNSFNDVGVVRKAYVVDTLKDSDENTNVAMLILAKMRTDFNNANYALNRAGNHCNKALKTLLSDTIYRLFCLDDLLTRELEYSQEPINKIANDELAWKDYLDYLIGKCQRVQCVPLDIFKSLPLGVNTAKNPVEQLIAVGKYGSTFIPLRVLQQCEVLLDEYMANPTSDFINPDDVGNVKRFIEAERNKYLDRSPKIRGDLVAATSRQALEMLRVKITKYKPFIPETVFDWLSNDYKNMFTDVFNQKPIFDIDIVNRHIKALDVMATNADKMHVVAFTHMWNNITELLLQCDALIDHALCLAHTHQILSCKSMPQNDVCNNMKIQNSSICGGQFPRHNPHYFSRAKPMAEGGCPAPVKAFTYTFNHVNNLKRHNYFTRSCHEHSTIPQVDEFYNVLGALFNMHPWLSQVKYERIITHDMTNEQRATIPFYNGKPILIVVDDLIGRCRANDVTVPHTVEMLEDIQCTLTKWVRTANVNKSHIDKLNELQCILARYSHVLKRDPFKNLKLKGEPLDGKTDVGSYIQQIKQELMYDNQLTLSPDDINTLKNCKQRINQVACDIAMKLMQRGLANIASMKVSEGVADTSKQPDVNKGMAPDKTIGDILGFDVKELHTWNYLYAYKTIDIQWKQLINVVVGQVNNKLKYQVGNKQLLNELLKEFVQVAKFGRNNRHRDDLINDVKRRLMVLEIAMLHD